MEYGPAEALPQEISLVLGDAVHNLKTALDLAWVETITALIPTILDSHTRFPFRDTKDDLINALQGRKIHESNPRLFNLVIDDVQPYYGGNNAIWSLHALDIRDKHKLLIPVLDWTSRSGLQVEDNRGTIHDLTSVRTRGHAIVDRFPAGSKIKNEGKTFFEVQFEAGLPLQGAPVLYTMQQLAQIVHSIVIVLESLCLVGK